MRPLQHTAAFTVALLTEFCFIATALTPPTPPQHLLRQFSTCDGYNLNCRRQFRTNGRRKHDVEISKNSIQRRSTQRRLQRNRPPQSLDTALQCQLLGMNCSDPTDFTYSLFSPFAQRGGNTDIHSHGWGLAIYEATGSLRKFLGAESAATSPVAKMVGTCAIQALNMIAHIRYATCGKVSLDNVHPFQRELWGFQWCFAHNGDVPMFKGAKARSVWLGSSQGERKYVPIGDTDSEALFCAILNALKAKFDTVPPLPILHATIKELCQEIVGADESATILNFLLGCGEHAQFVYSWPGARPGSKVWNGLHFTVRDGTLHEKAPTSHHLADFFTSTDVSKGTDVSKDIRPIVKTGNDRVAVIATKPLTSDENWVEVNRGELILFHQGMPHHSPHDTFFGPELAVYEFVFN